MLSHIKIKIVAFVIIVLFCLNGYLLANLRNFKNSGSDCWIHAAIQCISQIDTFNKMRVGSDGLSMAVAYANPKTDFLMPDKKTIISKATVRTFRNDFHEVCKSLLKTPQGLGDERIDGSSITTRLNSASPGGSDMIQAVDFFLGILGFEEKTSLHIKRKTHRKCSGGCLGSQEYVEEEFRNFVEVYNSSIKNTQTNLFTSVDKTNTWPEDSPCPQCHTTAQCELTISSIFDNIPEVLIFYRDPPVILFAGSGLTADSVLVLPDEWLDQRYHGNKISYNLVAMGCCINASHAVAIVKDTTSWKIFDDMSQNPEPITINFSSGSYHYSRGEAKPYVLFFEISPDSKKKLDSAGVSLDQLKSKITTLKDSVSKLSASLTNVTIKLEAVREKLGELVVNES